MNDVTIILVQFAHLFRRQYITNLYLKASQAIKITIWYVLLLFIWKMSNITTGVKFFCIRKKCRQTFKVQFSSYVYMISNCNLTRMNFANELIIWMFDLPYWSLGLGLEFLRTNYWDFSYLWWWLFDWMEYIFEGSKGLEESVGKSSNDFFKECFTQNVPYPLLLKKTLDNLRFVSKWVEIPQDY